MGIADKISELVTELQSVQGDVAKLETSAPAASPAPADGSAVPAVTVDASALADLQAKVDALGKERDSIAAERDAYKAAIQAEIDDQKADSARLEKAIAPVESVPVEAEVPVVPSPDQPAASVSAGINS